METKVKSGQDGVKLTQVMSVVTAALLLALVAYCGAWYKGAVYGDLSVLLLVLTLVTFAYWLFEKMYLKPRRKREADAVAQQLLAKQNEPGASPNVTSQTITRVQAGILREPWWIEWTAGFFWVILIVFVLRSFVAEPFRIPSGSMEPTLQTGDFILVNKYQYGLRLPVANVKIFDIGMPQRGDVIVFRLPTDERIHYIKRIIGMPGDEVVYENKQLTINGEKVPQQQVENYTDVENNAVVPQYEENLLGVMHRILRLSERYTVNIQSQSYYVPDRPFASNCQYQLSNFSCKVPDGYYFVMGDNRDNSVDSRYWGFVPEENIVGRAFFVWMNFGNFSRIGKFH